MSSLIAKNVQIGADTTATNNFTIYQPATPNGTLLIGNGNTGITSSLVTLTSAGNVGIGTSSPALQLEVNGSGRIRMATSTLTSGFDIGWLGGSTVPDAYVWNRQNGPMLFGTNNAERMRLDSSGNLGLGVTPSAWSLGKSIEIAVAGAGMLGNGNQLTISKNAYFNAGWKYARTGDNALQYDLNGGTHAWYVSPSGTAGNAISFTQAMTLDASGNLAIGTTSYRTAASYNAFALNGTTGSLIDLYANTTRVGGLYGTAASTTVGSVTAIPLIFVTADTEKARIDSSGNFGIGVASSGGALEVKRNTGNIAYLYNNAGTGVALAAGNSSWSAISDERLKDVIEPITDAANKVSSLRAVIGKYKSDEDGKRRSFLIAQDVQAVLPEAVSPWKIAEDETEYLGVQYTDVIPLLVAAIKEQQALITTLQADVAALKAAA